MYNINFIVFVSKFFSVFCALSCTCVLVYFGKSDFFTSEEWWGCDTLKK